MRLTLQQIEKLVSIIVQRFTLDEYRIFTDENLNFQLDSIINTGNFEERVRGSIEKLNSDPGGRGDELIQSLEQNITELGLVKKLRRLKRPDYVSPTLSPDDAILLGKMAFVDRRDLREQLVNFYEPDTYTSHVLRIRGDAVCGKTHSWHLIRHIALKRSNAKPICIRLDHLESGDPVTLMQHIKLSLNLPETGWPVLRDDPQDTQVAKQLAAWFYGKMGDIAQPVWLVIDDLNGTKPTLETIELIEYLAVLIEHHKPDNLWLVLIGFSRQITDDVGRYMLEEKVFAPERSDVRNYFESLGESYSQTLTADHLDKYVDTAFKSITPPYDHKKLQELARNIERISIKVQIDGGFPS